MRLAARLALVVLLALTGPLLAGQTVQERLGHPASARLLIIHADDVGMAHSVNRASFEALESGAVTSASILVPCPWLPEVAAWARNHPEADLGIHLALNSEWTTLRWGPVLGRRAVPSLLDESGYLPLLQPPVAEHARLDEVERELKAQVETARAAGIRVSHLDTHMNTLFSTPALFQLYVRLGRELGLPVLQVGSPTLPDRQANLERKVVPDHEILVDRVLAIETMVDKAAWLDAYRKLLVPLPPGVYELIVHLAHDDEEMRAATVGHVDYGSAWRQNDFDLVRSPAFRRFLQEQGFVLVGWKDLTRALPGDGARSR